MKKVTSVRSKTSAPSRVLPKYTKDDIYISMVHLPDLDMYNYKLECHGCDSNCDYAFLYRKKLSFAFVGKFAGVFSMLCKKLDAAAAPKSAPDGQLSLISPASEG